MRSPAPRSIQRAALVARLLLAALVLAFSTVVGVVAAFVALAPAAVRLGPVGRRVTPLRRPHEAAEAADASAAETTPPAEQALR